MATTLADIVNYTFFIGFQSIGLYLVSDAPRGDGHIWRMFSVAALGIILSLVLIALGQMVGLLLRDYPRASSFIAPLMSCPWLILSGQVRLGLYVSCLLICAYVCVYVTVYQHQQSR